MFRSYLKIAKICGLTTFLINGASVLTDKSVFKMDDVGMFETLVVKSLAYGLGFPYIPVQIYNNYEDYLILGNKYGVFVKFIHSFPVPAGFIIRNGKNMVFHKEDQYGVIIGSETFTYHEDIKPKYNISRSISDNVTLHFGKDAYIEVNDILCKFKNVIETENDLSFIFEDGVDLRVLKHRGNMVPYQVFLHSDLYQLGNITKYKPVLLPAAKDFDEIAHLLE